MASSNEYANQETEMQGIGDADDDTIYENIEDIRNNLHKKGKVRGKNSWLKTIFAIVCIIVAIAIASAVTVIFIKVMNNERTLEKSLSMLNTLAAIFNESNKNVIKEVKDVKELTEQVHKEYSDLEKKLCKKLNETEARHNNTIDSLISKLRNLEEKLYMKLNEAEARHNNTIDSSIIKLRNLEGKLYMKLNEAESRLNNTIDSSITKLRTDLEQLIPVASCDQTSINGVHTLTSGRRVYCSDGWTVFQRRKDGSIPDFHTKTWDQYREGFGELKEEFWLGLRKLHEITQQGGCRLRVDLHSWDNDRAYAEYSRFAVADEENLFRLSIGGYSGTAGDSLTMNNDLNSEYNINGMSFSTNNRDNDKVSWTNCAELWNSGGWWYNGCFRASLNGLYGETSSPGYATSWQSWKGSTAMKFIQMGVRCD